jgi:hypothetical protein
LKSDIGCWVGVVAEGINPMDPEEVIRAISTRSNPGKRRRYPAINLERAARSAYLAREQETPRVFFFQGDQ